MSEMRALIANEPRAYREVIHGALATLRPLCEFLVVEPENLAYEVSRKAPRLVICSRLIPSVESGVPYWIELYPEGAHRSVVSLDGERATVDGMDFDALLSTVDRAALR